MLQIRQIALVARHDLVAAQEFIDTLGLAIAFHDPGIKGLGLHNTLMPIGTQLLEIVAPITEGTTAERFLLRRKGAGGYMVITQTDDHPPRRARVEELGIRIVGQFHDDDFTNMQLHPADTGGSFLEIDQQVGGEDPMGPWSPAGKNWQQAIRTDLVSAITAAEMQCEDPEKVGDALVGDRRDRPRRSSTACRRSRWTTPRCASCRSPTGAARASPASTSRAPTPTSSRPAPWSASCPSPTTTSCSSGCAVYLR